MEVMGKIPLFSPSPFCGVLVPGAERHGGVGRFKGVFLAHRC